MIRAESAYKLYMKHEQDFTDLEKAIISRAKAGFTSVSHPLPYGWSITSVTNKLIALGYTVSHNKDMLTISWKPINNKKK